MKCYGQKTNLVKDTCERNNRASYLIYGRILALALRSGHNMHYIYIIYILYILCIYIHISHWFIIVLFHIILNIVILYFHPYAYFINVS